MVISYLNLRIQIMLETIAPEASCDNIPQTGFACRGSNGPAKGPWFVSGSGVRAGPHQTLYLCTKMDLTLKRTVSETNFKGTFAPNLVNSSKNCTQTHQTL